MLFLESHQNSGPGTVLCHTAGEEYDVFLYDKWNRIVYEDRFPKEPIVTYLTDNLVEILFSVGSPAHYVYYINVISLEISDVFFNPILIDNEFVAYWDMEEDALIIRDIFQEEIYCQRLQRDFSPSANPIGVIQSIELTDEGDFVMQYFTGNDYEMVEEIIPFNEFEVSANHSGS